MKDWFKCHQIKNQHLAGGVERGGVPFNQVITWKLYYLRHDHKLKLISFAVHTFQSSQFWFWSLQIHTAYWQRHNSLVPHETFSKIQCRLSCHTLNTLSKNEICVSILDLKNGEFLRFQVPPEWHLQEKFRSWSNRGLRVRNSGLPGPLQDHIAEVIDC